jgi:hypothetical protein
VADSSADGGRLPGLLRDPRVETAIAVLVGILFVLYLVYRDDPTPVIAGDSLVAEAAGPGQDQLHGTKALADIGHDPCEDREQITRAGRRNPRRIVLAYTGNSNSPATRRAVQEHGVDGLGQAYAACLRQIRADVPASVTLVVVQPPACDPRDQHGSLLLLRYLRTATLGGVYPTGSRVPAMPNAIYSTAADDRLTPHHVFRVADDGGDLRTDDKLHLTPYGAQVYGAVLLDLAAGRGSPAEPSV